jgi:tetratricopeptide (TPR) repeat protein
MPAALKDPYVQGLALSQQGRFVEAIESFEIALKSRPDDSRVLFALGNTARSLGMAAPAENFYRRVLALEPERVEAIVNLANLLKASNNSEAAKALLEPALARNPDSADLHLTLGTVHREAGAIDEAEARYRKALALRPSYALALSNLADILTDREEMNEALALYGRAIVAEPANAQMRLNRAVLHFLRGNLEDGWRDYAARLKIANKVPVAMHGLRPWDGKLKRTRLLVAAEQGVGDQVMFASVIPDLQARAKADEAKLILECEPRIVTLFARSFSDVVVKPWVVEAKGGVAIARYDWLRAAGGANAFVHMGTLPKFLRKTAASFPAPNAYLACDVQEQARWRQTLAGSGAGPFVGICWRSGKTDGARALQFASLETWAGFIRDLAGTIVSVQYDARPDEIAALETMSGRRIFVPENLDQKNELDRTAAFLSVLDAVVSAPTAVSWLSAAAGTSTFKILYDTSWTALAQDFEPFAPACRCIRPASRGDWKDAFSKTAELLKSLLN